MTALGQDAMEFRQRLDGRLRRTQAQAGARRSIQHPAGNCDNDTRCRLDMNDLTRCSALAVLTAHPAPIQRVPAIEDFNFLPEMGRMTARWRWEDRIGSSQAACGRASALRR